MKYTALKRTYHGNGLYCVTLHKDSRLIVPRKEFDKFTWLKFFNKNNIYAFINEEELSVIQKDLDRINKLIAFK